MNDYDGLRDKVELIYWPSDNKKSFPHVALRINKKDQKDSTYISYYPESSTCWRTILPDAGNFKAWEQDIQSGNTKETMNIVEIKNLNIEKMEQRFNELENGRPIFWYLYAECIPCCFFMGSNYSCSTIVSDILIKGGIREQLFFYDRFGSFSHILLLISSRISIVSSLMAANMYSILYKNMGESRHEALWGTVILLSLNTFLLSAGEYGAKKIKGNKRLIEIDLSDYFIGFFASIGFGIYPLMHGYFIIELKFYQILPWARYLTDILSLSIGPILSAFTFSKLVSFLVYLTKGSGYLNHPNNILNWVVYLNKHQGTENEIKNILFAKEFLLLFMPFIGYISGYMLRKMFDFDRNMAVFSAVPMGIALNAILTGPIHFYLNCKIKNYLQSYAPGHKNRQLIEPHISSLLEYSCVYLGSMLGMMSFVYLAEKTSMDAIEAGGLSAVGSIIGFGLGHGLNYITNKIYNSLCNKIKPAVSQQLSSESESSQFSSIVTLPIKENFSLLQIGEPSFPDYTLSNFTKMGGSLYPQEEEKIQKINQSNHRHCCIIL